MTLSASELNKLKYAPTIEGVLPVLGQRWSPRSFTEREVAPPDLARIFEAARWAASSGNQQPWRFLLGGRNSITHKRIASVLAGFNKEWAPNAPVLILGTANTKSGSGGATNAYALYDLGAASSYLTLQASALGLVTHQMAGYDHDAARQLLEIPEGYALGSVIALGYQGEPGALPNDQLIAREIAPRERKPLGEMVFSAWGERADLG
ncbi:MAG TPA: nitroreductase family protein [Terracidiphilus sp.]|nr:nitroreductase family protein [Terracidiphilus sp.]